MEGEKTAYSVAETEKAKYKQILIYIQFRAYARIVTCRNNSSYLPTHRIERTNINALLANASEPSSWILVINVFDP